MDDDETKSGSDEHVNPLPFRLIVGSGPPYMEYEADLGGGCRFKDCLYEYQAMFLPICRLMEAYRELEGRQAATARKLEETREIVKKLEGQAAAKDKSLAGYEAQLKGRRKAPPEE